MYEARPSENTSAVYVSRYIATGRAIGRWMDLVKDGVAQATPAKTCDQPRSNLLKLESLILAQSERWRQA